MSDSEMQTLKEELEQYKTEKEKIRQIVGGIGGTNNAKRDKIINYLFAVAIIFLLIFDFSRLMFHLEINLPPFFSMEIGILLISVKIIWMIHMQTKVDHFQFWILNSIEFRLNSLSKEIRKIKKQFSSMNK